MQSTLPARLLRGLAAAVFALLCVAVAAWAFAYLYRDIHPHDSFQARFALSGWGSWVLNLVVCELWLRRGAWISHRPRPAGGARSAWSRPGA